MVTRLPVGDLARQATGALAQNLPKAARSAGKKAAAAAKVVQADMTRAASGVLGISGERMSKVDTAWLRMDSPSNLMMIVGVWVLKPGIDYDDLCDRVGERLLAYARFRQRVDEDAAGATWVEDPDFDIHRHVRRAQLPRGRKGQTHQQRLQDLMGEVATTPLDHNHPLWQMDLIESYERGSALVVRIHHCIADGIALISVMMSLVDGGEVHAKRRKSATPAAGPEDWIANALIKPLTGMAVKALDVAGEGAAKSLAMLTHPQEGLAESMDLARLGFQVLQDAAALALMPNDSPTRLKGSPGTVKRVAWCQPVALDRVKAVCKALNASVNDVLLSSVAGAIGHYIASKGDPIKGREIRAMVPVNLRPLEEAWKLGNRFGLVPLVLPIGIDNPVERVYEVRRRMGKLKGSTQPLLAFGLLAVAGLLIKPAQDAMLDLFGKKTTAVMTNVPGPREKLRFCGSTLDQSLFWVPQSGGIGLGVSILSYGGGVQFGVITDTVLCPDPQNIIDAFEPEFERLEQATASMPRDS